MVYFPPLQAQFSEQTLSIAQPDLEAFWQQGEHGTLHTQDGVAVHYSQFIQPSARAHLLISSGRVEASEKYMEACFDFYQAGFCVHLIDHRGQGRSSRLTPQKELGYVASFDDYVADLALFIDSKIQPHLKGNLIALGHSMGSAILARYLQNTSSHPIKAAVFCSPMFGLITHGISKKIAYAIAKALTYVQKEPCYFPGQKPYKEVPFAENHLCQSLIRYQCFRALYQKKPELKLGGASSRWIAQALKVCAQIQQAKPLTLPQLLLQSGADTVVCNQAQWIFANQTPNLTLHRIAKARHELFLETDEIRAELYQQIECFLQRLGI